ncbi:MAG: peptidase M23 [Flavobacteriaceae bacterium]|nr:MAG: peptidase M23 [Flavobacteriaceae bacterium]
MAKVKYYYDSETLSYRKIKDKKRHKFTRLILTIVAAGIFMILGFVVLTPIFESPSEKKLKRELEYVKLNEELHSKKLVQLEQVLEDLQVRDNNIYRVYFELSPVSNDKRNAGFGGVNRYKTLEGFDNSAMIIGVSKNMDILAKQLYMQSKSLDEIVKIAENKEDLLAAMPAIQPVRKQNLTRMASGYGWRSDPFTKARKMHKGMDFTAPRGTPIFASGDGKIIRADNKSSGYGKHIRIDHGFGYVSLYAHLSKYNTRKGRRVKRGDLIGYVGNTGRSQAPHLHYEVRKNGKAINPINFYSGNLTPEEFVAMQKAAQIEGQSLD